MKKPESKWEVWEHFGGTTGAFQLSEKEEEFLQWGMFTNENYIFVPDKEHREIGWCSRCREYINMPEWVAHKDDEICPHCGVAASVRHVWRGILNCRNTEIAILYGKSVLDPEIVTARMMLVTRNVGYNTLNLLRPYDIEMDSWYVFQPKLGGTMVKPLSGRRIQNVREYDGLELEDRYEYAKKATMRGGVYQLGGLYNREMLTMRAGLFQEAVEKSPLRYGTEEIEEFTYRPDARIKLLDWVARYSSVEKLIKMGLKDFVRKYMEGRNCVCKPGVVNWRGKTVEKIFGGRLTKADKRYLLEYGGIVDERTLDMWKGWHGELSMEEAKRYQQYGRTLRKLKEFAPIRMILKYLGSRSERGDLATASDYLDYLEECKRLGYDLRKKDVLRPKCLADAHRRTTELVRYKENEMLEAGWKSRRAELVMQYEFAAGGFLVVIPEKANDLIREGQDMHNCVGGYVKRVSKGETDVVYIRKASEPEKSFGTMEIRDGVIVQARAAFNKDLPEDAKAFVELFRQERLEGKRRRKSA